MYQLVEEAWTAEAGQTNGTLKTRSNDNGVKRETRLEVTDVRNNRSR